jgi:hypothetical protein
MGTVTASGKQHETDYESGTNERPPDPPEAPPPEPPTQEEQEQTVKVIENFICGYASIPNQDYLLPIALWVLTTHCQLKFDAVAYLIFTSDAPGSGKTRALELLDCVCKNARMMPKITLPALCATVEANEEDGGCTILYDQAERLGGNENSDLMSSFLAGYRPGMKNMIQRGGVAVERPIFCPKALALLGDMLEAARDRSIVIPMRAAKTKKRWKRKEAKAEGAKINGLCRYMTAAMSDKIDDAIANFNGLPFLGEREDEIFSAVFIMCDVFCPDRRPELERAASDICGGKRAEPRKVAARDAKKRADAMRDGERLIKDLLMLCGTSIGIRTGDALTGLKDINAAPWRNYAGVGLTDQKLAELVRYFGIAPRNIRLNNDGKVRRGYLKKDLEFALKSYFGV